MYLSKEKKEEILEKNCVSTNTEREKVKIELLNYFF